MSKLRDSWLWKVLRNLKYILRSINSVIYSLTVVLRNNSKPHIFFCGYSESSNLGDMAQIAISFEIFKNKYSQYKVVPCRLSFLMHKNKMLLKAIKHILTPMDVFVMESGYNTNDGPQNVMHRKIISNFPNNKILFLQQTIQFKNENNLENSKEIFNKHDDVHFICRDKVSYKFAQEHFEKCRLYLYPDLVTFAIGKVKIVPKKKREGIFVIKRNDAESFYRKDEIVMKLNSKFSNIRKEIVDTVIPVHREIVMHNRNKYILDMLNEISKHKVVITDRYHGLIFSLIANVPVVVLKTNNHKVTTAYEWLSEEYSDAMFFANDIDDAIDIAKEIYDKSYKVKNGQSFYKRYYDEYLNILNNCFSVME